MYAVINTGGKQVKVQPGDIVQIEKLVGDKGSAIKFSEVLLVSKPGTEKSEIWVGQPLLSGATVDGQIVAQGRGEKILIIKMKRRIQYRRTQGHRQEQTQVLITQIDNGSGNKLALSNEEKSARLAKFTTNLGASKGTKEAEPKKRLRKKF